VIGEHAVFVTKLGDKTGFVSWLGNFAVFVSRLGDYAVFVSKLGDYANPFLTLRVCVAVAGLKLLFYPILVGFLELSLE